MKSPLWEHFYKNNNTKKGICKACNKELSYSNNYSSLKKHLKNIHQINMTNIKKDSLKCPFCGKK